MEPAGFVGVFEPPLPLVLSMVSAVTVAGLACAAALAARLWTQPVLEPVQWTDAPPLPRLAGPWARNERLVGARVETWAGTALAPEAFALDATTGALFASCSHAVVRVPEDASPASPAFFAPAAMDGWWPRPLQAHPLFGWCLAQAAARNESAEEVCGRPLGVRAVEGALLIADAHHGVWRVPPAGDGPPVWLVRPGDLDPPARFFNDLDALPDGGIVFTDSSTRHPRRRWRLLLLENSPDGRLFLKPPGAEPVRLLAAGLHFPNGVQALPGGDAVAVVELGRRRLLRCGMTVAASPGCTVMADNLPCIADNVRLAAAPGELLVGCASKAAHPFSLPAWVWGLPRWQARLVHRALTLVPAVEDALVKAVASYGLVLRIGLDGEPLGSLHDPTRSGASVSTALQARGRLWLGSHKAHHARSVPLDPA